MILDVRWTTHWKLELIRRSEPIEPKYCLIGEYLFNYHTTTNFKSKNTIILGETWGVFQNTLVTTLWPTWHHKRRQRVGVLRNFRRQKFLETPNNDYSKMLSSTRGSTFTTKPTSNLAEKWSENQLEDWKFLGFGLSVKHLKSLPITHQNSKNTRRRWKSIHGLMKIITGVTWNNAEKLAKLPTNTTRDSQALRPKNQVGHKEEVGLVFLGPVLWLRMAKRH